MRPVRTPGPAASRRTFHDTLIVAFVLSGVAGLIYESIWSRYVALLVGHGAYAQVLVLVTFMAGMAGGALFVAGRSERLQNPLMRYAAVEGLIGLIGLAFHPIFVVTTGWAYDRWFPALGGTPWVTIIQWGLAVALLLPQSLLLGATFPLMSAAVVRRAPRQPGRTLALLYFANSLGAAVGGLLSGFWLVRVAGLPGTVLAAAALNLLVAAVVFRVARSPAASSPVSVASPPSRREPRAPEAPRASSRLLLAVSFGTAVASFVYEIAWIRMLSLVLGSATHSFELMLSAFILGLALGALWARTRADRLRSPLRTLAVIQWAMGALALATLPLYAGSFHWMAGLVGRLRPAPHGYELFSLARYGICLAVMLPATCCAGVTLPLLTRLLMSSGAGERAIGQVYGANTLGSIAGAALAGLALLPWLGLERLLAAGALVDMLLGVALLSRAETASARRAALPALAGAMAVTLAAVLVRLDPLMLVSGVYRTGELLDPAFTRVIFYRDGRTATVSVRRQQDGALTLSTNGKPDASLPARWLAPGPPRVSQLGDDESTQLLIGLISLAHAPAAERAAVVGQGSGVTSHVLLGSTRLRRLVTIEIEPQMIAASRAFSPANHRVFDDPRARFAVDDARSYLAASPDTFDLIVSEPSNPWVSGVSGLFTDELYRRVRAKLGVRGVLGQWLHLYSLDDDLALRVLAGIHRNFADYRLYLVSSSDMLVVASNRPGGLAPDWGIAQQPGFAAEQARTYPFTPRIFEALRIADRATLAPLLSRITPNSDYFPVLDLGAERARFETRVAGGFLRLHEDRFGIAAVGAPVVDPPPNGLVPVPRGPPAVPDVDRAPAIGARGDRAADWRRHRLRGPAAGGCRAAARDLRLLRLGRSAVRLEAVALRGVARGERAPHRHQRLRRRGLFPYPAGLRACAEGARHRGPDAGMGRSAGPAALPARRGALGLARGDGAAAGALDRPRSVARRRGDGEARRGRHARSATHLQNARAPHDPPAERSEDAADGGPLRDGLSLARRARLARVQRAAGAPRLTSAKTPRAMC